MKHKSLSQPIAANSSHATNLNPNINTACVPNNIVQPSPDCFVHSVRKKQFIDILPLPCNNHNESLRKSSNCATKGGILTSLKYIKHLRGSQNNQKRSLNKPKCNTVHSNSPSTSKTCDFKHSSSCQSGFEKSNLKGKLQFRKKHYSDITSTINSRSICAKCDGHYSDDDIDDPEDWIECPTCKSWFHETCAGIYGRAADYFVCEECSNSLIHD